MFLNTHLVGWACKTDVPYEIRAEAKPVVMADIKMLPIAAVVRFVDCVYAYIWSTPAGIDSANISIPFP